MARNALGQTSSLSVGADVLAEPMWSPSGGGIDSDRMKEIRNALKKITSKLRCGCLTQNAALDAYIPIFQQPEFSRAKLSFRILAEFQNLMWVTFYMEDASPNDLQEGGYWEEKTNSIHVRFGGLTYVEYVLLREFVRKCMFNSALLAYGYTEGQIQSHARLVADAIYNCACQ